MSNVNPAYAWGTDAEVALIERLSKKDSAIELLEGYLAGAAKRSNWGDIDRAVVVNYAHLLLRDARKVAA